MAGNDAEAEEEGGGTLERREDAGRGPAGVVKLWLMELELARKTEKKWRKRAAEVDKVRRGDARMGKTGREFNILAANVETLRPSLYSATPKPDVRRRFRDKDPLGKMAALALERALAASCDLYDFDGVMEQAVLDYLLPGRAVTRVRYVPHFAEKTGSDGQPYEAMAYEEVIAEHVDWQDFRRGPGRKWSEVPWIAFRSRMTVADFEEAFGKELTDDELKALAPDHVPDGVSDKEAKEEPNVFKRITTWEIFDKVKREKVFIAPAYASKPLKVELDKLKLRDFFPIPRPMYAVESSDTLIPVEEYRQYKDQAEELNTVTARINKLVSGMKVRGVYASVVKEFEQLLSGAAENDMIATNGAELFGSGKKLEDFIWMMPIREQAEVLMQLVQHREQVKQIIYEVTGLADVLRGATDPEETLGAQQLKANWGSKRMQRRSKEIQRYARDIIRLKGEIIAERFAPETIRMMTGLPVTPEMMALLRDDGQRGFRIDIETDSTVAGDVIEDQKAMTELLGGISKYVAEMGPAVASGYVPAPLAFRMLATAVRRFKMGREVEEEIDQLAGEQIGPDGQLQPPQLPAPPPSPEAQAQEAEMAMREREMAGAAEERQAKAQAEQQKAAVEQERAAAEADFRNRELDLQERTFAFSQQQHADAQDLERLKITEARAAREDGYEQDEIKRRADGLPADDYEENMNKLAEAVAQLAQAIVQGQQQQAQRDETIMQALMAPKEIVFDGKGRPTGVRPVLQ